MRTCDEVMEDLYALGEDEELIVTAGVVKLDDADYYEVFAGRVELDGKVFGVISEDSVEDALDRAAAKMEDYVLGGGEDDDWANEEGPGDRVSVRHIEAVRAVINEVGFDRAVALLECLK
jgi:hypothetical protein